ncbi:glycosyltransferase [Candidatus Saccharibacteria bacterium]|nr:glycosyltransferase [Candidatus Saccharibacteria bacterium]
MKKIKILMVVEGLGIGGIETYVRSVCKHIDKNRFDVSVLIVDSYNQGLPEDLADLEREGIGIFFVEKKNYLKDSLKHLRSTDVVHFQVQILWLVLISRVFGKKVILHSHFGFVNAKVNKLKQWLMRTISNLRLAPSSTAGNWLFGQDAFRVVANGFDGHKFLFNAERRKKAREELGIKEDEKVMLQVGRFGDNKNQLFSIGVLNKLMESDEKYRLVAIGQQSDVSYINKIRKTTKELGMTEDRVALLPPRNDLEVAYSMSDLFIMPSRYEGLPYAALEAQTNGLRCFLSDTIPREIDVSGRVIFLPIDEGVESWANAIGSAKIMRSDMRERNTESRHNINNSVRELEKIYIEVANG